MPSIRCYTDGTSSSGSFYDYGKGQMAQALYRKWRSQTFEEVVGQEHVTQTLRNALRDGRIAHAYLFSGPRGTGKTSTARILAKAVNCKAPEGERPCNECPTCIAINEGRMIDLIEIDAASNNSVDDIRELRDKVGFSPSEGLFKIYIIDEVHMLSTSAFNALLKTLEEPPPHARFVLATTEPHKIPATVLSRCQRFDFRRIPVPEISAHLKHIADVEGFGVEDEALAAIGRSAQGCMRDAVSLLDQMRSFGTETVSLDQVQQVLGAVSAESVASLVDALADKDVGAGLSLIQELLTGGASLTEFCLQVVEYLRGIMVIQMTGDVGLLSDLPADSVRRMQGQAERLPGPTTLFAIKRFSEAIPQLKGGYQPQLPMELALIESIQGPTAPSPAVVDAPAQAATTGTPQAFQSSGSTQAAPAQPAAVAAAEDKATVAKPELIENEPAPLDTAAVTRLRAQWKQFTYATRKKAGHKVQAALNTVRDIAVSEDTVVFAFGANTFTCDMIAKPETLNQVSEVLGEFLGRSVKLECQMGEQAKVAKQIGAAQQSENTGPDPLVEYAVTNLRAEVVE